MSQKQMYTYDKFEDDDFLSQYFVHSTHYTIYICILFQSKINYLGESEIFSDYLMIRRLISLYVSHSFLII